MVVRLSVPRTSRPLPPGRFLVLIPVRGWVDHRATVQFEGLGESKNPMTSGIETSTFQLVAQCLDQLCYRVPSSNLLPMYKCRWLSRTLQVHGVHIQWHCDFKLCLTGYTVQDRSERSAIWPTTILITTSISHWNFNVLYASTHIFSPEHKSVLHLCINIWFQIPSRYPIAFEAHTLVWIRWYWLLQYALHVCWAHNSSWEAKHIYVYL
jgi:hypothetical protein